jgi:hypothetical protein
MELIAAIEEERIATRILAHLGLPVRAPPRGRPWTPQRALPLVNEPAAADHTDPPSRFE